MSSPLFLRAFVEERLTAAAEEIFQFFESTIAKYEEEASSSKQEIERLRGLLSEPVSTHKTDVSPSSHCKEETPPEQHHCEQPVFSVHQGNPEPCRIKEEDHGHWAIQQQEGEETGGEFEGADALHTLNYSVWEKPEQKITKVSSQSQTQNDEYKEVAQFQEMQESKHVQFNLLHASTPTTQTLLQDGRESKRPVVSFTSDKTQTEQSKTSFNTFRESSEVSHLNSSDYHCCLCNKSFSSSPLLIKHAFQVHSKKAGVTCAVCGETLESNESLNLHLQSHRASKCCHICGKNCSSTTALTEHMASHAGVKLHRCHVCGKECTRKGDLKIHMRIHTGEKPYCCSFCCKGFTHSGHLRKHMRSHTGERPHRCNICGKGFLQSAHLKYHLGTHAQKY
ncbi:histone-lysine N-methyltransferase PRDM9-like [Parambassis ranga]|uniref:Histone-lysine N-methyltransferase PRDM9-like n=1 Tax=Parambassis ranga TaxID=210632 RepID=A0A6P7JNH0_9TELE|nr:histone-lysine N-methyltransferase PRDM9-like [Parambassis ranga]